MKPIDSLLDVCREVVRKFMGGVAKRLDSLSGGAITPNMITIVGLLAHIPIAWEIAMGNYRLAAVLLVIFGLFDTLDGALARVQNRVSKIGMLLDSVTDRVKEVMLYTGAAYVIVAAGRPYMAVWAVAACGASLLVSYINAWGEAVLGQNRTKTHAINKAFRTGLMTFEIRMIVVVVGLLSNRLTEAIILIAILSAWTAISRFVNISRELDHVQD